MLLTKIQLREVIQAGGSVIIDASVMTMSQLQEIVSAAATNNKVKIMIKNVDSVIPRHLVALSTLAPGQVTFDLTGSKTPFA